MDGISSFFEFVKDNWNIPNSDDDILGHGWTHLKLTLMVLLVVSAISISLGVYVQNKPKLKQASISTASIFLTLPSLALFGLFIPLVGTGFWPVFIALCMYGILPILRNTITGLDEVNPAVVESAKGMGMTQLRQLTDVRIPLAWPVIMAGIRVSAQLVIGIAAIAPLVGYGGLGRFIQRGLTSLGLPNSLERVWTGTVFVVLLALVLDLILGRFEYLTTSKGIRR